MKTIEPLHAGELRHVVDVEQPTGKATSSGTVVSAPWNLFATIRCGISPTSGNEKLVSGEFLAEATHIVTMRYLPGLVAKMRLNYKTDAQRSAGHNGRIFDVLNVNDVDELHRQMILTVKEAARTKST